MSALKRFKGTLGEFNGASDGLESFVISIITRTQQIQVVGELSQG